MGGNVRSKMLIPKLRATSCKFVCTNLNVTFLCGPVSPPRPTNPDAVALSTYGSAMQILILIYTNNYRILNYGFVVNRIVSDNTSQSRHCR